MEDYQPLFEELTNDPKGLGYSGKTDQWCSDKLNEIGASNEKKIRETIETKDILECLVWSELSDETKFTPHKARIFNYFSYARDVDPNDNNIQNLFLGIFNNSDFPNTRANLIALASQSCSRAEVLGWGTINEWDVSRARAL